MTLKRPPNGLKSGPNVLKTAPNRVSFSGFEAIFTRKSFWDNELRFCHGDDTSKPSRSQDLRPKKSIAAVRISATVCWFGDASSAARRTFFEK